MFDEKNGVYLFTLHDFYFFTFWMVYLLPQILPILTLSMLAIYLVIDGIIITLSLNFFKIKTEIKRRVIYIIFAFIFGLVIDIIFALFIMFNLLLNLVAFFSRLYLFYCLLLILIAGFLIFVFNYWYTLKRLKIEKKVSLKIGLLMGILTAPWLFLVK